MKFSNCQFCTIYIWCIIYKENRQTHVSSTSIIITSTSSIVARRRWSMLENRGNRERFLVSVSDTVSGESLAELHHSGARDARANVASSPLFFLAAVLARSSHVLRWRLDRLPQVPRGPLISETPWPKWRERDLCSNATSRKRRAATSNTII